MNLVLLHSETHLGVSGQARECLQGIDMVI
jgi:hypothetical protein